MSDRLIASLHNIKVGSMRCDALPNHKTLLSTSDIPIPTENLRSWVAFKTPRLECVFIVHRYQFSTGTYLEGVPNPIYISADPKIRSTCWSLVTLLCYFWLIQGFASGGSLRCQCAKHRLIRSSLISALYISRHYLQPILLNKLVQTYQICLY